MASNEKLGTVLKPTPKPTTLGESPASAPTSVEHGEKEARGGATRTDS